MKYKKTDKAWVEHADDPMMNPDPEAVEAIKSAWEATRPEGLACGSDPHYAGLATQLHAMISKVPLPPGMPDSLYVQIAVAAAMYLEDIVSEIGVWSAMRRLCERRYGFLLPFYDCKHDGYMLDNTNAEDLMFIVWDAFCKAGASRNMVYSPAAPGIGVIANGLFEALNLVFEDVPENTRLSRWVWDNLRSNDYIKARDVAQWLVIDHPLTYMPGTASLIERTGVAYAERLKMPSTLGIYNVMAQMSWLRSMSPMGVPSAMLVGEMANGFGFKETKKLLSDMEVVAHSWFRVRKEGKVVIFIDSRGTERRVTRASLGKGLNVDRMTYAYGSLVKWGPEYWELNGMLSGREDEWEEFDKQPAPVNMQLERERMDSLISSVDGRLVQISDSRDKVEAILGKPVNLKDGEEPKNYELLLSREKGVALMTNMAWAFSIEGNEWYDAEKAAKESFGAVVMRNHIPYDTATYIAGNHLLQGARIMASQSEDAGLRAVQEYLDFWIGYYRTLPPEGF